jgi:hypothetical protein
MVGKISEMDPAAALTGAEQVEVVQSGVNKRTTTGGIAALAPQKYRGLYVSLSALNAAIPTASAGDYADVDSGSGSSVKRYIWDSSDNAWVEQAGGSSGMTNPMTTAGDLIVGGAAGVPARLPVGAAGKILGVASGTPAWVDPPAGGGSGYGVAVSDYAGGDPTGAANSHTQVAAAIATGNEQIYLQPGALYRDDAYSNPMGAEFIGGGKIVKNITGGQQQLNTNADKNQRVSGQEYAFALHNFLMTQYATPTRALSVRFSGDSTTAGDGIGASSYHINNLFKEMMYQEGLNPVYGITSTNAGQSGKNTEDWNTTYAAADAAAAPDLLVLRWGVNDGSRGAAAFITSLRAGLAQVRASRSLSQTTILLMAPNSTSDTVHMRDEKYYEAIIPGIKQAARDYQCVFADTYSYLKDARPAANVWMDDPYADGSAIHPKGIMNVWIAQLIAKALLPKSLKLAAGKFEFRSIAGLESVALASTAPAGYLYGHHIHRATPANGFPVDGTVLTWRSQDGLTMQINYPYKTADQATHWVRYGSSSSGAGIITGWSPWVDTGSAASAATFSPVITVTTTTRNAALTDVGGYVNFNNTAPKSYTVMQQSTVAWTADAEITVVNDNTSDLTLVADTGVTLKAPSGGTLVLAPDMVVTLKRTSSNIWRVIGQTK